MATPFVKTDYPPTPMPETDGAAYGGFMAHELLRAVPTPTPSAGVANAVRAPGGTQANESGIVPLAKEQ